MSVGAKQLSPVTRQLIWLTLAGVVLIGACGRLSAAALTSKDIQKIHFEQKLDRQISLDLSFVDEKGREVQLKQYFANKPVILVMVYYECPMLCGLVLNGVLEAMKQMKASAGQEFTVLCVSIDPTERPRLAAAKKASYLKTYLRPGAEDGWHFLTGKKEPIQKLADQVGFQFAYDSASKQYAHPSGIVVVTPTGKVSRYFFGVNYSAKQLDEVVKDASWNRIGVKVQEFLFLCFHYTPFKGKYAQEIMVGVRVFGLATLAGVASVIWWSCRSSQSTKEVRQ